MYARILASPYDDIIKETKDEVRRMARNKRKAAARKLREQKRKKRAA